MTQVEPPVPPPALPPLVQRAIARLIRVFVPERVVLFGSYAKGTNHNGSDIDLLVIANVVGNHSVQQRHARQLVADCFPSVDVVLTSPAEIAEAETAKSPFLQSVLGTGITIYTSANIDRRRLGPQSADEMLSRIDTVWRQ